MTTENHHERHKADDSNIAITPAVLPVNSTPGDISEIEYESALESCQSERAQQAQRRGMGGRHGLAGISGDCVIRIPRHPMQRQSEKESIT